MSTPSDPRTVEGPSVLLDRAAVLEAASCLSAVGDLLTTFNERTESYAQEYLDEVSDALLSAAFGSTAHLEDEAWASDEVRLHTYVRAAEIAADLYDRIRGDESTRSRLRLDCVALADYHRERAEIYRAEGTVDLGQHVELPTLPGAEKDALYNELGEVLDNLTTKMAGFRKKLAEMEAAGTGTAAA